MAVAGSALWRMLQPVVPPTGTRRAQWKYPCVTHRVALAASAEALNYRAVCVLLKVSRPLLLFFTHLCLTK